MRLLSFSAGEWDVAQPGEILPVIWDFAESLVTNEVITSVVVTIFDKNKVDVTTSILKNSSIVIGSKADSAIQVVVQNLVDGERYEIDIIATISVDKKRIATIFLPVKGT